MRKQTNKTLLQRYFKSQTAVLHHLYLASEVQNHNPDTGYNREKILIDWLSKHLPEAVSARSGGKIIDSHHNESKQVDVVIYEKSMPQLGGNEKTYYFAEGIVAAIEVKSKLTPEKLKEAFRNLATVKKCKKEMPGNLYIGKNPRVNPLTGLFAYDTSYKTHDAVQKALDKYLKEYGPMIDFICINQKVFFLYSAKNITGVDYAGNKTQLPTGYSYISNEEETIWRFLSVLSEEARSAVFHGFDMLLYFMKGKNESK